MHEFSTELFPGVRLGQKLIPCGCAGCYVPGGRFAHAASAIMSIATAKAAGVPYVVACSPARDDKGINPYVLYAMSICSPDVILTLGGVQAIAAMAFACSPGSQPTSSLGPATATWPKPNGFCTERSASTCLPGHLNLSSWRMRKPTHTSSQST